MSSRIWGSTLKPASRPFLPQIFPRCVNANEVCINLFGEELGGSLSPRNSTRALEVYNREVGGHRRLRVLGPREPLFSVMSRFKIQRLAKKP